jgi:hypothetical protein
VAQRELARARKSSARVEHAACTPEHGRAPRGAAVPPAQSASIGYGPTLTSAAGRAHVASACATPPPERERARARGAVRTCARSQVCCSCGARGLHAEARPCTEGGGRPAGTVGFLRVRADSNQRGGARARRKRACYASSRERASARGWRSADLRALASQLVVWSTRACTPEHGRAPRGAAVPPAQ